MILLRQTWGYGPNGILAQVAATAADAGATAITVNNRFFEPGQPGARFISPNQVVDGGTVASPQGSWSAVTVSTVSISTNPATVVDTIQASAGGFSGVTTGTTYIFNRLASGNEMAGIQGLIDDFSATNIFSSTGFMGSTVQNINRGAVSAFNATILANSAVERVIDGNLMQQAFDQIQIKSGKKANIIWGHHDVCRAFLESVSADRRYSGQGRGGMFDAGAAVLSYEGVPIVKDRQAPYNSLLVMDRDVLKIFKLSDFKFADQDGAILARASDGSDSFDAFLRAYLNLGIDQDPKGAVMIRDIKVDF